MWFRMNGLTGMITGSGRVSLLSGRIQRYRVRLGLTGQFLLRYAVHAREPLGRGADRLGCAGRAHAGRPAGPRRRFGPKAEFK
jgi:hypothetical protein